MNLDAPVFDGAAFDDAAFDDDYDDAPRLQSHLDSLGACDYLAALYRLTGEQGRDITPEDLIHELRSDPEEVAEVLAELQDCEYLVLDEGFLTLTSFGQEEAEFTLVKHARAAAFLAGVLKLSPQEACRNAARIRHVMRRETFKGISRYLRKHNLDRIIPETEMNLLFPSLTRTIDENYGYLFDPLYLLLEDHETPTIAGISEFTGMRLGLAEREARKMEERGLLETIGSDGVLTPTPRGLEIIYDLANRHMEITSFLKFTLGLEDIEAQKNAWKWKFLLSGAALKAIRAFLAENGIAAEQG